MYRQKEKVDDAYPLHRMRKKQMEHTWTKEFYQETDPAKRQQILKEHIGEEEAWEEEYRTRLWTARYGQRRLQKDEFVRCLMELKYLAEGTSLDPGGDRSLSGRPACFVWKKNSPCSGKPPSGHIARSIRTESIF